MKKIGIGLGVLLVILCVVAVTLLVNRDNDYVAKVGNEKVYLPEFYLYLYEQKKIFESRGGTDIWEADFNGETPESVAKQNALASVSLVKISADQAERQNISLTDQELMLAQKKAQEIYNELDVTTLQKTGITQEIINDVIAESFLANKLYEQITANFVISESDFDHYFKKYLQENEITGDIETVKESEREKYINSKKKEIFETEYQKWAKEMPTEVNEEVWASISITDL